jgi:hypothetical protein
MDNLKAIRFAEFWRMYVAAHRDTRNRALHFAGTLGAIVIIVTSFVTSQWALSILAPIWGYAFAWVGHCYFERNRPMAFRAPIWAFRADLRMFLFTIIGRMTHELERLDLDMASQQSSVAAASKPGLDLSQIPENSLPSHNPRPKG